MTHSLIISSNTLKLVDTSARNKFTGLINCWLDVIQQEIEKKSESKKYSMGQSCEIYLSKLPQISSSRLLRLSSQKIQESTSIFILPTLSSRHLALSLSP